MSEIAQLTPRIVWDYFDQITRIPRPSKKEEKIMAYLSISPKVTGWSTGATAWATS